MNETNGPGAVVPVGWMRTIAGLYPDPSIYTPAVLERGTPILPGEAKKGDLFFWTTSHSAWTVSTCEKSEFITPALERRYEYAWLRPHAAPSPQPAPGSDAEPAGHVVRIPTGWMPVTGDVAYHSTRDVDGAIFCPAPSIYTPAVLERGTPILPEEARRLDLFWDVLAEEWLAWDGHSWLDTEARAKSAWLRPHAAPSPQPAPGSDAEREIPIGTSDSGYFRRELTSLLGRLGNADGPWLSRYLRRLADVADPAAPPQESDKGRGCGQAYHDERGEVQDCEEGALCRRCLERQLAEARDALLAYQEALRSAVSEARPALWCYPSGVLEYACPFCGEGTMRKRDDPQPQTVADIKHRDGCFVLVARPAPADVVTPSSTLELADLLRKRYPRLLDRGNPLYDGVLAAAVERAGAADAVVVPREEWEALRRFAERCAQRDHQPDEHIGGAKCIACEAEDALRSGEAGKERE